VAQSLILACSSTPTAIVGSSVHGVIRVRLKSLAGTGYLGDSGVTTGGYPLSSGDAPIHETLMAGESLWVASSSGATVSLAILRVNETT
jgi:hypothetical protein